MEIPLNVGKKMHASDTGGSFFTGIAVGALKGVVRTGVGLYEAVTFLLPVPEGTFRLEKHLSLLLSERPKEQLYLMEVLQLIQDQFL